MDCSPLPSISSSLNELADEKSAPATDGPMPEMVRRILRYPTQVKDSAGAGCNVTRSGWFLDKARSNGSGRE
jgi:hypothetical protein